MIGPNREYFDAFDHGKEFGRLEERKRIIAKARERASRFPYFPHGDALRNFANELEAEDAP